MYIYIYCIYVIYILYLLYIYIYIHVHLGHEMVPFEVTEPASAPVRKEVSGPWLWNFWSSGRWSWMKPGSGCDLREFCHGLTAVEYQIYGSIMVDFLVSLCNNDGRADLAWGLGAVDLRKIVCACLKSYWSMVCSLFLLFLFATRWGFKQNISKPVCGHMAINWPATKLQSTVFLNGDQGSKICPSRWVMFDFWKTIMMI